MTSLRRNISLLYGFSFLQMTLFPMAVITLFWKDQIGLSLSQILLLQSIFAVAMVVMEYPSGYISDRLGYRTALTLASVLGIAGWGVYTVASSFRDVLIAETLLGISTSFISGTDSALLYESLKGTADEAAYGRFEGRSTFFGQTGEAAGALFAGVIYARYPLIPFVLQVAVWVLALLLTRGMAEPPRERHHQANHLKEALASARYVFIENRRLRVTVLLSIALGLSSFYPVWLIQPYMRSAGVPLASFGPIWAGANLTVAIVAVFSHRLREQLRDRGMIFLLVILVWGGYLGLGLAAGIWGFLFYYLLTAMRGMRGPFLLHVAQTEIPSANRAGMLSLQSLCFRLLFAVTGPLLGRYADAHGVGNSFLLLFLAYLLVLPPLVWLFLRQRHGVGSHP
ncbi:MFS transporter [Geobacter hydrogenophilus]|uniref:MFS transporter n=2 Tax=Geobacter hydrogenophilus TaxID=40983 RepID=A0A9W6G0J1_9BACT|nr:MFS transporter [Geobacter hydrogenophilus]GLI38261.1 MFS transporter [Geobacter hydrogenophilus]